MALKSIRLTLIIPAGACFVLQPSSTLSAYGRSLLITTVSSKCSIFQAALREPGVYPLGQYGRSHNAAEGTYIGQGKSAARGIIGF